MARKTIEIGVPSTGNSAAGTNSLTFSHATTAGNHRVLVVGAGAVDATVADTVVTGVTFQGTALTLVDSRTVAAGNNDVGESLWILHNPPEGTGDVVITFTGNVAGSCGIACQFNNCDWNTPQDTAATGTTDTSVTSISTSLTSVTAGALGVDLVITRLLKTHAVGSAPQALIGSQVTTTGGEDATLSMSSELKATAGAFTMSRSWTTGDIVAQSMMVLRPAVRRIM